jgi:hypothetical protein
MFSNMGKIHWLQMPFRNKQGYKKLSLNLLKVFELVLDILQNVIETKSIFKPSPTSTPIT